MSVGPLRRVIGILGLLALIPIALSLAAGTVAPEDAAMRAVAVGLVVVGLGRLARTVLTLTARRFETDDAPVDAPVDAPEDQHV